MKNTYQVPIWIRGKAFPTWVTVQTVSENEAIRIALQTLEEELQDTSYRVLHEEITEE